jgi:hypothetical protein
MSAAAPPASGLANSPALGGGFDRPQVAITIGLEWRLPPARAIETNDLQKTLDELGKRSGTQAMVLTDTMAPGTQAHIYEALTSVVTPKH